MQILTADIGTGTQDVFVFDPALDIENGYKLVMPSPTMIAHRRIKEATGRGEDVLHTSALGSPELGLVVLEVALKLVGEH